ncbi:glycosyltransferase family 4 protein [Bacillus sp. 165]|uniref:glycosyltransferase family 4 protein n=1 Tax=Bacillus sp. 165 TaxID=1529117 RepID=UPI001ADB3E1F|nr:glycosyltransferase family 4 protein [Bacillus sp. 165]MBO9131019.1 glycosyltransferase family 4 protein [Bacillus sp. 165]
MKVLHVISGGETGGSRKHLITLLSRFPKQDVSLVVFQEGTILEEARENGIDVHLLKQTSRYDLSVLSRYTNFINNGGYEIVHTHGPRANLFTSLIKHKIHAKWVCTIHSDPALDFVKSGIKGAIFTKLNLFSMKKIDLFFAVSNRFKKNLMSLGIPEHKIVVIYNGLEFNHHPYHNTLQKEDLNLSSSDFVLTMIARLHPIKGHEVLFEALQTLKQKNIKVLLVGDGPIEQELKKAVTEKGLSSTVQFLGFRKDVDELLSITDVNLLTSYSESFPLVLLEAAQHKVTCIATNVGGVADLINSPELGWVIPPNNAEALRNAIIEAYELYQKNELSNKGEKLYQRATSHFSLESLYKAIRDTYEGLV